jgi:hypothetical protein
MKKLISILLATSVLLSSVSVFAEGVDLTVLNMEQTQTIKSCQDNQENTKQAEINLGQTDAPDGKEDETATDEPKNEQGAFDGTEHTAYDGDENTEGITDEPQEKQEVPTESVQDTEDISVGTIVTGIGAADYSELEGLENIKASRFIVRDAYGIRFAETEQAVNAQEYITQLKSEDASILFVQPDYTLELNGISDGWAFRNEQGVEMAEVEPSQMGVVRPNKLTYSDYAFGVGIDGAVQYASGESTVIAILDTAMDTEHEQIADHLYQNTKETEDGTDTDENGYIDDTCGWDFVQDSNAVCILDEKYDAWHATSIAGVIAETAPESKILPLKVFENGQAYTSDIIRAIAYCRSMGVQLVNCSWTGTDENPLLREMMAGCTDMLFICAAGNDGKNLDEAPVYPAAYDMDNVITVASVNQYGQLSPFSNYSVDRVDIASPGEAIRTSLTDCAYSEASGTSIAAAFVSAAAALLSEQGLAPGEIKQHMEIFAQRLYSLHDKVQNGQMLNVSNLFEQNINNNYLHIRKKQQNPFFLFGADNAMLYDRNGFQAKPSEKEASGWQTCGAMTQARSNMASAVSGNNIYVFGGTESGSAVNKTEMYDTRMGAWLQKASMPEERYKHTASEINGKIYICGGYNSTEAIEDINVYDIASDTWESAITVPNHNTNYTAAAYDGKLYIFGGKENGTDTTKVYVYEPETQTWVQLASMTTPCVDGKTVLYNEGIRVFAGWNVFEYNVANNSWRALGSIGRELSDFAVVTRDLHNSNYFNDAIYVTGGLDQGSTAATVETRCRYGDSVGLIPTTWYRDLRLIRGLACHNMVVVNGSIYAFGGQRDQGIDQELMFRRSEWEFPDDIPDWKYGTISNGYVVGAVNDFEDVDTFQFSVDETAYYNVRDLVGGLNPHNTCISIGTTPIYYRGNLEYIGEIADFWLKEGVTYYLHVGLSTSYDSAGNYDLRLVKKGDDAPDSLDKASEIKINTPYTKTFSNRTDKDCMYVQLTHAGSYQFHVATASGTNANVTLFSASKQKIDSFMADGETNHLKFLEAGNYYIQFEPGTMYQPQVQEYNFEITQYGEPGKMVRELMNASALCADGTLYVVGGTDQNYQTVNTIQRFDAQENMFSIETTMPYPRKGMSVISVGSKIYLIGGYSNGYSDQIDIYDIKTKQWSYGGTLIYGRERAGIASDGNKIYIAGGRSSQGYTDTMEIYDIDTKRTSSVKLPECSMDAVLTFVDGKLYLAGGVVQDGYSNRMYMYDSGVWTEKTQMPYAAEQVKGTVYGHGIVFAVSEGKSNKILYYNTQTNKWSEQNGSFQRSSDGQIMQRSILYYEIQSLENRLYLIGGHDGERMLCDLYTWDLGQINENNSSSSEIQLQAVMGKTYPVVISAKDISSFSGKEFIVSYDTDIFDIEDLCAQTWSKDMNIGDVANTDIKIVKMTTGEIVFESKKQVADGQAVTGAINMILFKAKKEGNGSICVELR